jgi:hypothetical protein
MTNDSLGLPGMHSARPALCMQGTDNTQLTTQSANHFTLEVLIIGCFPAWVVSVDALHKAGGICFFHRLVNPCLPEPSSLLPASSSFIGRYPPVFGMLKHGLGPQAGHCTFKANISGALFLGTVSTVIQSRTLDQPSQATTCEQRL